jgi:hypothetical protein
MLSLHPVSAMKTILLILLLIASGSAFSQKTGSRSKTEDKPQRKTLRSDIFGECYVEIYVDNPDGTVDTVVVENPMRPDCFGLEIRKPDYEKTGRRNTPDKDKSRVRPPQRKPATQMLSKALDSSNQKAFADSWMVRMISQRGPTFSRSSDSYIDFGVTTNSLMLKSPP